MLSYFGLKLHLQSYFINETTFALDYCGVIIYSIFTVYNMNLSLCFFKFLEIFLAKLQYTISTVSIGARYLNKLNSYVLLGYQGTAL
jgi:hypothetical protein